MAKENPMVYKVDVAQTNYNMAIFYKHYFTDRNKSISHILTTIAILLEISDIVVYTQKYLEAAVNILRDWGLNNEEISRMVEERIKEIK